MLQQKHEQNAEGDAPRQLCEISETPSPTARLAQPNTQLPSPTRRDTAIGRLPLEGLQWRRRGEERRGTALAGFAGMGMV